jgi:hypothetical protein
VAKGLQDPVCSSRDSPAAPELPLVKVNFHHANKMNSTSPGGVLILRSTPTSEMEGT